MSLKASFFTAAEKGDVKELKKLLKEVNPNIRNKEGETPLHIVAGRSHLEAVKLLLDHGADPNAQNEMGETPLHYAAGHGYVDVVKLLLERGADPHAQNKYGGTPLHYTAGGGMLVEYYSSATKKDHVKTAKILLERGADPNARDYGGRTPLHEAAERCEVDVVKLLLQYGADPNARDDNGQTPLHRITDKPITLIFDKPRIYYSKVRPALYFLLGKLGLVNDEGSCAEVIGLLVKHGADPNAKDKHGKTPLGYAIDWQHEYYITLLAKYGANWIYEERPIYVINCDLLSDELKPADVIRLTELVVGRDALSLLEAAGRGDVEEVKRMLIRVDPNTRDICGRAPLHYAAREGRVEVMKLLLERGAYPNAWDNGGMTPLHYAAERGDVEIVRLLLEKWAYPNARDQMGRTPLHEATKNGHVDVVRLLLEHGANPNAKDEDGRTPLHEATKNGHVDVVKLLLEHGADPNAQNEKGETPLHTAARWGRVDVVRLLLERGADFKSRDAEGRTPVDVASASVKNVFVEWEQRRTLSLFDAVTRGDVEGVKLWLERGVDPNVKVGGSTPLHVAAERGYVEIVELLLSWKWRVEVDARDGRGFTPLQYACFGLLHAGPVSVGRYRDVVVALLRRGADPDVRDEEGNTVLHWAASRGHGWVVDLLVRYGADLYAKNKRGRTPLDVAVGEAKTVLREWARRFKGEAPPPPRGYIEIEPLDEEVGRGGVDRK